MSLDLYIKEELIEAIANSESITIQLNNDLNDPSAIGTISTNMLELVRDGAKIVNQYIADGTTGGMGIFEGPPARLEFTKGGETLVLIDGYLDLADPSTEFECDKVTVKIVQRGGNDWFQKRKKSFTYSFLASLPDGAPGKISSSDNVYIPYIISKIPNTTDLAIISISVFVLGAQIRTVIKDLFQISVEFAGVASAIRAAIKIILYISFLIILIIAMIKLIQDLVDLIIQPLKFHAGMRIKTLLEKGAEYMGQKFESTNFQDELFADMVIIPSKFRSFDDDGDSGILGFKKPTPAIQTGYFDGTYDQVLEIYKGLTNGREIVGDGIIRVERVDKNTATANYKVPAVEILSNKFNTDELKSNTSIRFSTDLSDTNTIDQLEGTFTDIIVEPLGVENEDMLLLSGEKIVRLGVSQTKRKDDLTKPEEFLSEAVQIIAPLLDSVMKVAPGVSNKVPNGGLADLFENRKGVASVSNDFHEVPKVVTINEATNPVDTKIKDINATRLTSEALYNESYFVSSFVPTTTDPALPNQWRKYNRGDITFCFDDYKKVVNNNYIFDSEDNVGKLISLDWNPELEVAEKMEYWLQQIYTTNLKETILTPDGL